ncbi:MAG: polymer-forming cytoskeletal protein [Tannerella sp.]|jgi:cytoskeletal protein CcmA (bactofilin family)|nr:polymer-forming cytoskeletal protein [Tannerella sp.]
MTRNNKYEEAPVNSGGVLNVLAAGTSVKGSIVTEADFRLDGRIEGDINCKGKIVIGPRGLLKGNIVSENAEILGAIEGSIKISEKLILKASSIVQGDIFIRSLEIEPGAAFNGTCTMSGKDKPAPEPPKVNVAPPKDKE